MPESFTELLARLSADSALFSNVEEAIRQGVVLPILAHLGWNTYNIYEVIPEFPVGSGRVDYCLRLGEKKTVFVEVKRASEDLERHQKQLLEYAFTDGVEIAVLTNGLIWWLYLPLGGGSWEQRKFFTIDLQQQSAEKAVRHFADFLGREAAASGSALKQAKSLHASRTKQNLIAQTVPRAWQQLIEGSDEQLMDLLADRVEGMCGHRPDMQFLDDFMKAWLASKPLGRVARRRSPRTKVAKPTPPKRRPDEARRRRTGTTIDIDGERIEAQSVPDLYEQVLRFLVRGGHMETLTPYLPFATSAKRYLLATEPVHQRGNEFVIPVEYKGYYMEAHKDYTNALRSLMKLLRLCGLTVVEIGE